MGAEQSIEHENKKANCRKEESAHQSFVEKIKQKTHIQRRLSKSSGSTKKKTGLFRNKTGASSNRPLSGTSMAYITPRHSLSEKSINSDHKGNPMTSTELDTIPLQLSSPPSSPLLPSALPSQQPQPQPTPGILIKHSQSGGGGGGAITPPPSIEEKKFSRLLSFAPQGHKYVTSQEVVLDLYLRPSNELDRRKERDRQQRLHYLLKLIWKGIYSADLKNPSVIVNWCCGVGLWNMEMATLFPNTRIIGVDFKEATFQNSHYRLPNMEFRYAVIHDQVTGLESFQSDSVDFFIMRDCWLINAPIWKWDNVFREAYRILRPGGWIEVEEHSLAIQSKGINSDLLSSYFDSFFAEVQVERDLAVKLGDHLACAGFQEIEHRSVVIPVGEWPSTECLKETGFLARDLLERRIRGLRKWVCETNDITENQFDTVVTNVMDDEVHKNPSTIDWNSYLAKKPGQSPERTTTRHAKSPSNAIHCSTSPLFIETPYIGPNNGKF